MIRFITAGESHGKALVAVVEGFPSNLPINRSYIDNELRRRQSGYGRGGRMSIEKDTAVIISGVRYGKTLGSPIAVTIDNLDWVNWKDIMDIDESEKKSDPIVLPRPGHADLTGSLKYNYNDIRNSIERSSARETAARVAAGAIAKRFLEEFGIFTGSFVESIGGVYSPQNFIKKLLENQQLPFSSAKELNELADKSNVRVLDQNQESEIITRIKTAKKNGDSLGGTFCVVSTGLPAGLGSFVHYDRKINAALSSAVMSINAVKGVEIGAGFSSGEEFGSKVHDEIVLRIMRLLERLTGQVVLKVV
jgi:chorismate synthase